MEQGQRQRVRSQIEHHRISAIVRTKDQSLASDAMEAAVEGGFRLVEFTLTTPGALELIAGFSKRDELIVGAGTVMSTSQAREAVSAGALFLVSPIVDPEVIREAAALEVPMIPGAYTPTEMETAHRCGADFVKVFPATASGASFITAVRGPLPHLRLFPTAGVTPDNFLDYLEAGCAGVGFVRSLFEPDDLAIGNFSAIRDRAAGITKQLAAWCSSR
jgi:Entner-Doudoroff aldolase